MHSTVLGYLLVVMTIIAWEICRFRHRIVDALTLANLFFLIGYCFTPIALILGWVSAGSYGTYAQGSLQGLEKPLLVFIGFCSLQAGWCMLSAPFRRRYALRIKGRLLENRLTALGLTVFVFALGIFVSGFGGYREALLLGDQIRYGEVQTDWRGGATRFFGVITLLLYYWYVKVQTADAPRENRKAWCIFIVCCVGLLTTVPLVAGRGYVISVIIVCYLISIYLSNRLHVKALLILSIPVGLIAFYGKQVFFALPFLVQLDFREFIITFEKISAARISAGDGWGSGLDAFLKEFAHAPISLTHALSVSGEGIPYTYFRDIIFIMIAFVPQTILMIVFDAPSISLINTQQLEGLDIASIPPGFLAHSVYALGVAGLMVGPFLFGAVGGAVNELLEASARLNRSWIAVLAVFGNLFCSFILNGDIKVFIQSSLTVPIYLAIILCPFLSLVNLRAHSVPKMRE